VLLIEVKGCMLDVSPFTLPNGLLLYVWNLEIVITLKRSKDSAACFNCNAILILGQQEADKG